MSPHAPAANFDPVARLYRWMEYLTFGSALQRCRIHFLLSLADRRAALVLGDGDGRFLARLLATNPTLHADAVDSSAAMLRRLSRRTSSMSGRLRTHHADALDFPPTQTYDLIVTHFFLDCLTQSQLEALAQRLARHTAPKALWLVSDFRIPTGPLRWPARVLVSTLYFAFRLLTGLRTTALPDHAAALTAAGFIRIAEHHSLAGLLTSELWEYTPTMQLPPQRPKTPYPPDPVPDPEPPSPSLPEPDPGVFHHDTCAPKPGPQVSSDQ
jgi:SAM-dependent methyltransferase